MRKNGVTNINIKDKATQVRERVERNESNYKESVKKKKRNINESLDKFRE